MPQAVLSPQAIVAQAITTGARSPLTAADMVIRHLREAGYVVARESEVYDSDTICEMLDNEHEHLIAMFSAINQQEG